MVLLRNVTAANADQSRSERAAPALHVPLSSMQYGCIDPDT